MSNIAIKSWYSILCTAIYAICTAICTNMYCSYWHKGKLKNRNPVLQNQSFMLVSAEAELIFSAVASMRMCFGLALNTELLYREPKTFLLFVLESGELECLEGIRRQSQDRWPRLTKEVFQAMWHHDQYEKWWEEGSFELEGMFTNTGITKLHDRNSCCYVCREKQMWLLQCWKAGTPQGEYIQTSLDDPPFCESQWWAATKYYYYLLTHVKQLLNSILQLRRKTK